MIQLPITNYTDLDKSRLLRDFMKFVSRISAHERWLIVDVQFPPSYYQTSQCAYHLRRYWGEDPENRGAVPGVNSQITPRVAGEAGQ